MGPIRSSSLDPSETNGTLSRHDDPGPRDPPEFELPDHVWEQDHDDRNGSLPQMNLCQTFRHSGWKNHRKRVYRAMYRTVQPQSRLANFAQCGSHAYVLKSPEAPHRYKIAGSACHDRLCTPCANTRARIVSHNVMSRIGKDRVRFLTLTVKTDDLTLTEAIDHLTESFTKMKKRRDWRKHVAGGVAFLEIKWNEHSERWHPHLHILAQGTWWDYREISNAWLQVTGDSPVIDITLIKDHRSVARYVTKYACKPLNPSFLRDDERLDEAVLALKGRRLATTFGRWRGIALTDRAECEAWENIGSLQEWLKLAAAKDVQGLAIVTELGACDLIKLLDQADRAPPSLELAYKPITYQQDKFWSLYTIY